MAQMSKNDAIKLLATTQKKYGKPADFTAEQKGEIRRIQEIVNKYNKEERTKSESESEKTMTKTGPATAAKPKHKSKSEKTTTEAGPSNDTAESNSEKADNFAAKSWAAEPLEKEVECVGNTCVHLFCPGSYIPRTYKTRTTSCPQTDPEITTIRTDFHKGDITKPEAIKWIKLRLKVIRDRARERYKGDKGAKGESPS